MELTTIYERIDANRQHMLDLWQELVNADCGSYNKAGVDAVGKRVAAFLEENGMTVRFHTCETRGDLLIAEYGDMTKPFVLFVGHLDTVFKDGTAAERPFTIRYGKAYGPGVLDMKGGIVIALYVMKLLKEWGYAKYSIKLVLAGDEEVGHAGSDAVAVIQEESKGAVAAFNFETGFMDNSVVIERKGVFHAAIDVAGIGAHAGNNPKDGRSAIREMAHKILAMEALTDFDMGNTVNVGVISGGTVANAVPEHCRATVDVRFTSTEWGRQYMEKIKEIVEHSYVDGTTGTMNVPFWFNAMSRLDGTMKLLERVNAIMHQEGFAPVTAKSVGGGSDSAYTTSVGVPTLCAMGVQGAGNHTVHEWADIESLFTRTKMMTAIMMHL